MFSFNQQLLQKSYSPSPPHACMSECSVTSVMSDSSVPWTVAYQDPRSKYWSKLPCLPPGDLPNPGVQQLSPASPALQADSIPTEPPGKPSFNPKLVSREAMREGHSKRGGPGTPHPKLLCPGGRTSTAGWNHEHEIALTLQLSQPQLPPTPTLPVTPLTIG